MPALKGAGAAAAGAAVLAAARELLAATCRAPLTRAAAVARRAPGAPLGHARGARRGAALCAPPAVGHRADDYRLDRRVERTVRPAARRAAHERDQVGGARGEHVSDLGRGAEAKGVAVLSGR